jgi:hypothetical protein
MTIFSRLGNSIIQWFTALNDFYDVSLDVIENMNIDAVKLLNDYGGV